MLWPLIIRMHISSRRGDDFFAMLTKGDVWAGQNYSKGVLKAEEDYNAQIAWATPEVGVPLQWKWWAL